MPQYQGIWTLAQAAQAQSTQRWVTDPLFENTTLLLQADNAANGAQNNTFLDSSSNNFTITRNGNTTQGTFTPFSLQPGAWGNFFGSANFFYAASNAAFALGTGDFTVEAWVFPSSAYTTYNYIYTTGITNGIVFYVTNNTLVVRGYNDTDILASTVIPTLNTWTHVAATRSGTTLRIFVNGVQTASTTSAYNFAQGPAYVGNDGTNAAPWLGYISNLRLVKGTAVYTSNFTPSPLPLTAITNTSLLTCQSNRFVDNSSNNFSFTISGTPSVQAFSPFAPQYQYTPSVTGGSGYFDGTGDYLSAAANTALTFGTGDFTVEGWFYANALGGQPTILNNGSDAAGLVITMFSSKIYAYFVGAGNVFGSSGATIVTNTWYHFAWVRSGSTNTFYLNGAVYGATYSSAGNHASTGGVGIGYSVAGTAFAAWNGYIANVRMVKGTAVYTGAFTPPIAPVTTSGPASSYSSTTNVNTTFTSTNTSLLTNFTNAGIYDGTLKNNLETVGNAQVSTSVVKYGTGSIAFDGSGDYLSCPAANAGMNPQTGDFTIECWVWIPSLPGAEQAVVSTMTGGGTGVLFGLAGGGNVNKFQIAIGNLSVSNPTVVDSSTFPVQTWTHVAAVRRAGVLYLYKNGVSVGTPTAATGSISQATLTVGAWSTGGAPFNGYLDDVRITAGIARYTTNFTPPTVALPRQ